MIFCWRQDEYDLTGLTSDIKIGEVRRGVAQLARVLAWGARGRKFKSSHSDHKKCEVNFGFAFFL